MTIAESVVEAFHRDGLAVVEKFATKAECEAMMRRMESLIAAWNPENSKDSVFSVAADAHVSSEYFFNSSDKIRFFLEPGATDAGVLKETFDKSRAVHKVGHALHVADDVFKAYSTSEKVRQVALALGWHDPVLPQSMYIFKQPLIGDAAVPHQDSTFLHTTPRLTCLGLWLALEDATLDNGCLWARPGSQKEGLRRVFVRNPAYFGEPGAGSLGDQTQPAIVFEAVPGVPAVAHEGQAFKAPADAEAAGFRPYPVKQGDLVLIHGEVDHMSFSNTSPASRHTYQLHLDAPHQRPADVDQTVQI
eukprot:gene14671-22445_t